MNSSGHNLTVLRGTSIVGTVHVGEDPGGAVYDDANGNMYVINDNSGNVSVVNGMMVVGSINVGQYPGSATYDDRNGFVYVLNGEATNGSFNITVIGGTSIVGTITTPTFGYGSGYGTGLQGYATYDRGNGYVYVANPFDSNVVVLNGTKVVASVNVGLGQPQDPTYDPGNGYVYVMTPNGADIGVINGTTLLRTLYAGFSPAYAAYDPDNGYLYVSNSYSGHTFSGVTVINGTTNAGFIEVGSNPASLVYNPTNGYIYVADSGSTSVHVIDGMTVVENISLGLDPYSLTYDGENGYVYAVDQPSRATGVDYVSVLLVGYAVIASETGLPSGAGWWINVTVGPSAYSNSSNVSFDEPFGTYHYAVSTSGMSYSAPSGSFRVDSGRTLVEVQFSRVYYPIGFSETGLPSGTSWSVTLGHTVTETAPAAIRFSELNGTYSYTIGTVPGWTTSPFSASTTVNGSAVFLKVAWTNVTYKVSFAETGLPKGTSWTVNLSGTLQASRLPTIVFVLWNGTYPYAISTTNRNYSAFGGFLPVAGFAVAKTVAFTVVAYTVTFAESGLPAGTNWSVTLGSTTASGAGSLAFWAIPNGTYVFAIGAVALYAAAPTSGTVHVGGQAVSYSITFTRSATPNGNGPATILGLPAVEGYSILEGIAVAALATTLAVVLRRRRGGKAPPQPAKLAVDRPRDPHGPRSPPMRSLDPHAIAMPPGRTTRPRRAPRGTAPRAELSRRIRERVSRQEVQDLHSGSTAR
jgi:YVTN family beta-propeller protein